MPNIHCKKCGNTTFYVSEVKEQIFTDNELKHNTRVYVQCSKCGKVEPKGTGNR